MQRTRALTLFLLGLFLLIPASPICAQERPGSPQSERTVTITESELTEIRAEQAELEGRRKEVAALEAAHKADGETITALKDLLAEQAKILELWKAAATERSGALGESDKIKASYEASVKAFTEELMRVRGERDVAVKKASRNLVVGFVAGVLAAGAVALGIIFGGN